MEIGRLFYGFHISLGAKIGDLHAKDSNPFCKRLRVCSVAASDSIWRLQIATDLELKSDSEVVVR